MDFNDTPEQAEFRAKARAFLDQHRERLKPGEAGAGMLERDDPDAIKKAKEWQATKKDNGWACLTWPKEYGGQAATSIQNVIWNQEETKYRHAAQHLHDRPSGCSAPRSWPTAADEQKEHVTSRDMARGQVVWCQLFSEPDSRESDLAGLRTSAVRDGDEWVINGQKIWSDGRALLRTGE